MNTHPGALKVSVIIPLYNKGPYIARALDSVLAQTVQEFEIIIVDGGSTDESLDVAACYTDPRITCFRQEGKGVSQARNQGVKRARAELIAFLDADDRWYPDFLETVLCLREKFPEAGMYGTGYQICDGTTTQDMTYKPDLGERMLDSYYHDEIDYRNMLFLPSSSAVDKNTCIEIGGWAEDVRRGEDQDFFARTAFSSSIVYSPKVCAVNYLDTMNNSSHVYSHMESPFLEMIASLDSKELHKRHDADEIIHYCDWKNGMISLRYNHSDKKLAQKHIKYIRSVPLKYIFTILSSLPVSLYDEILHAVRKVKRQKQMPLKK